MHTPVIDRQSTERAPVEYRERVLVIEPHGIEPIAARERHGRTRSLFTLWLSANMGLPVWLVGALAIVLGLGFADGVAAILVGNLVGCALLALTASIGPAIGVPQLPFTRRSFGARGVYLPAFLNWISTGGWYAVNTVLGASALARLTALPFPRRAPPLVCRPDAHRRVRLQRDPPLRGR